MKTHLVAYDVRDPKRLRRVHRVLKEFGVPAQYSVFLCRLSDANFEIMRRKISETIHHHEDRIVISPLCEKCIGGMTLLGTQRSFVPENLIIV